jgi:Glycosyl transferase family 2
MDGVPVFASLTTISSRIGYLDEVIESLNAQTLRAEKIVLNVSRDSFALDEGISFEDLPTATRKLAVQGRVEVYFTRNTGPYRKLLPLLRRMQGEDCLIASADDDVIYPPRWLEGLRDAFVEHRCVVAYRCRAMRIKDGTFAPYNTWPVFFFGKEPDYTDVRDEARQLLICPTGRGGIMYHPSFFPALDLVERLRTLAPMQDDLAFRFATLVQGIPVCPLHF